MDNQDWKPVNVGNGGKGVSITKQIAEGKLTKTIVEKQHAAKNVQNPVDSKKVENNEIGHIETADRSLSIQIQQARAAKKMTQQQLDTACNFPSKTVTGYENGKGAIVSEQLQKMSTVLGVRLEKPKKK